MYVSEEKLTIKTKYILPHHLNGPHTSFATTRIRGLAVMRPACHLDTQNTVFDSLDTQNFMTEFAEDDFS